MSDLFGGTDPKPASVTITVTPHTVSEQYTVQFVVAESTSRRRHQATVTGVPVELLADVVDAAAWWVNLAFTSTRGQHVGIPKKWERRTVGRIAGWARRER